ncbi:hypothetical protein DD752_01000 [Helicobacter pylori]|nr:hypothetical protein DD752_01000 [Helicobacter pylori]
MIVKNTQRHQCQYSSEVPNRFTHHISKGVTLHTSCARYECMGILYHELVAFIPNAKDDWDFY